MRCVANQLGLLDAGGGLPTAKDYIQDGLIAMFDGIENAGFGSHDPNATVWKDLTGNSNLQIGSNVIHSDHVTCTAAMSLNSTIYNYIGTSKEFSIEGCFKQDSITSGTTTDGGFFGASYQVINQWVNTYKQEFTMVGYFNGNTSIKFDMDLINTASVSYQDPIDGFTLPYLYLNGQFIKNADRASSVKNANGAWVGIGFTTHGTDTVVSIYSVRIYSRSLLAEEIAYNYAIDKARFNLQ